jgi:DNA-binding MarR family transcriptional regulator
MLQVRGLPGRDWAAVSELAERMQAKHHGVVSRITRSEKAGLVVRRRHEQDGRTVQVPLTAKGEEILLKLATLHLRAHGGQYVVPNLGRDRG